MVFEKIAALLAEKLECEVSLPNVIQYLGKSVLPYWLPIR